jgi:hypothetical protein
MNSTDEGRNSAIECSPWDGGAGVLPRGLGGRGGLGYQLLFLFLDLFCIQILNHYGAHQPHTPTTKPFSSRDFFTPPEEQTKASSVVANKHIIRI